MATRFQSQADSKGQGTTGAVKGVKGLTTKHALGALERLLDADPSQVGVMPIDWKEWRRAYGAFAKTPYLSLLVRAEEQSKHGETLDTSPVGALLDAPPEALPERLNTYLAQVLASILKVPANTLDQETPIGQMGFDSLMAVELKTQIEVEVGVSLPMARLIQGPSLKTLSHWLLESFGSRVAATETGAKKEASNTYEEGEF